MEILEFEAIGKTFKVRAVPTVHQKQEIESAKVAFCKGGALEFIDAQKQIQICLREVIELDAEGNFKKDDKGEFIVKKNHPSLPILNELQDTINKAKQYGELKVLILEPKIDLLEIEIDKFEEIVSAHEVALKTFRRKKAEPTSKTL